MQVSRWGNGLAIPLPAAVVEALRLSEGDDIEITIADERLSGAGKRPGRAEPIARLDEFRTERRVLSRRQTAAPVASRSNGALEGRLRRRDGGTDS